MKIYLLQDLLHLCNRQVVSDALAAVQSESLKHPLGEMICMVPGVLCTRTLFMPLISGVLRDPPRIFFRLEA